MKKAAVKIGAAEGAAVDPNIYGQFIEHIGRCVYDGIWVGEDSSIPNEGGIRLDTVEALRKLELPVVRWPGGCFADNYHWRDGIGPRSERPKRLNIWWDQSEGNAFGTHEFIRFCKMIGTEPYICANVGTGSPQETRDWVEYCNSSQNTTLTRERAANGDKEPFGVKFWGVGNENWGCGGRMTPESYADQYRRFATFMRQTDKDIKLIACGSNDDLTAWDEKFLNGLGALGGYSAVGLVDAIALHNYSGDRQPGLDFNEKGYYALMPAVNHMEEQIVRAIGLCRKISSEKHRVKVIMDEWGTWWSEAQVENGLLQPSTMRDAVFAALSFHMFHRHAEDVVMTNMAQTINILQALILTKGPRMWVTPTYWVYEMLRPHKGGNVVKAEVTRESVTLENGKAVPLLSASVTLRDGSYSLSLANVDANDSCEVTVSAAAQGSLAVESARVLTSGDVHDQNSPEESDKVSPRDLAAASEGNTVKAVLPPHSVAVIKLNLLSLP